MTVTSVTSATRPHPGLANCVITFNSGGTSWSFAIALIDYQGPRQTTSVGLLSERMSYQTTNRAKVTVSAMDASGMRGTIDGDLGPPSNNLPGDEQVRGAWSCS